MDVTYGLISNFVRTKSVERVLAPIASQVSLLIILNEGVNSHLDDEARETTPQQVASCTENVSHAVESFIAVANRQAKSAQQDDIKLEMSSACETLDLARASFYVAAQKFQANSGNRQIRSALVQSAKDVLQGILKVLLVSDNAEVKKITAAVQETKIRVTEVGMVTNMRDLVSGFKALTDSLMSLVTMTTKRQKDLINPLHREQLITGITVLRKSLAGLNSAMQTCLKYPRNPQAHASKKSVMEQIFDTLNDIKNALESKQTREATLNVEEPGYFVSRVNLLLDCLSLEERQELHPDFETWTAGVVRHSMAVAHLCTNTYRDLIVHHCQTVLQLKGQMLELSKCLKHSSPNSHHRRQHDEVCESLLDGFCHLEENVNMALLHLMVDVFKESSEPLERLLKAALAPNQTKSSPNVDVLVSEFSSHADCVYQVASLAAASSTDSKRVRVIRAAVYHLEKLDPDMVPSIKTVAVQPANMAALRHLKLLVKDWKVELTALVQVMDQMVDPELFIEVSEVHIDDDISAVRGFILEEDQEGASEAIASVFCRTKRVRQIAQAVVDHSKDAIYMNGLLVFIKKLQQAESITKEALKYLHRDFYNPRLQDTFVKHLSLLKGFVGQVKDGLSAENHPDILSPERMLVYKKSRPRALSSRIHKRTKVKQIPSYRKLGPDFSSVTDIQVQKSPLDKQISKLSSSSTEQQPSLDKGKDLQAKSTEGRVVSSKQPAAEVALGVKMSDIRLLSKQFVSAAVAGDRQRVNVLTSDLLGWTNHISDAAQSLTRHCRELEHEEELQNLCREADQLAPEAISKAKYVAAGDISEVASLQHTADAWADKFEMLTISRVHLQLLSGICTDLNGVLSWCPEEKYISHLKYIQELDRARIHLDVAVDTWQILTDGILTAIQKGNVDKLKAEITMLEHHKEALCSLLSIVVSIPPDILTESDMTLAFLKEQQDDLDNLTVTIKTTADLTLQTGNAADVSMYRNQLGQLCREWSVMVSCILGGLDTLTSQVKQTGQDKIAALREITQDVSDISCLKEESERAMVLMDCVCVGNDELKSQSSEISRFLENCLEELETSPSREFENVHDPSVYVDRRKRLTLSQWIVKMLEARKLVSEQTSDLSQPLASFYTQAVDFHRLSLTDPSRFTEHKNDYLCEVSKMAANFTMMQQKVLNAIQLSPDLAKRAVVRHCLDDITALSPQLLEKMKTFVEDSGPDDTGQEWQELTTKWTVHVKKLLLTLQQMSDLRPTLNAEILKLLTVEPKKKLFSHTKLKQDKTPDKNEQMIQTPTRCASVDTPVSRCRGDNSVTGTPTNKLFRSITSSAIYLEEITKNWENKDNHVIHVASAIVKHTKNIAEYCKGTGEIEDVAGLATAALNVIENARIMQTYIKMLADSCVEESHTRDLRVSVDKIGSFTTQLSIINSVLGNSPNTTETERIVLRNASNLVQAVEEAFHEAESVCIKGLVDLPGEEDQDNEIFALVSEWQRKLVLQRSAEASSSPKDELGLRRVEQHNPPSLVHLLQ